VSASSSPSGSPAAKITAEQLSKRLKNVTWTGTNIVPAVQLTTTRPSLDFRDDDEHPARHLPCRGVLFANVMRAWRRLGDGADTASSKDDPPKDQPTRIAKTYDYVNEDGDLAYQKVGTSRRGSVSGGPTGAAAGSTTSAASSSCSTACPT